MPVYMWHWKHTDGSDRHVEVSTALGEEVARTRALGYFPGDPVAEAYITGNPPEVREA